MGPNLHNITAKFIMLMYGNLEMQLGQYATGAY